MKQIKPHIRSVYAYFRNFRPFMLNGLWLLSLCKERVQTLS